MLLYTSALVFTTLLIGIDAQSIQLPKISVLEPQGLRFELKHVPGATLAAFHYTINSKLEGVKAGRWNYDVTSKSDSLWVHENRNVKVNNGDVVHYWVYMIVNGRGIRLTDQTWTVVGSSSSSNGGTPVKPHVPKVQGNLRLVMDEQFNNGVDTSKWTYETTLGGGGNWEFQAYTNLAQNVFTKNGKLYLKPTLTTDTYGQNFLTTGRWDVKEKYGTCTQSQWYGCFRQGNSVNYLNPVMSGKLMSKIAIRYGKVEIMAKMPRGDWIWPALWMLPQEWKYGGWPRSGEIDIMESRGNRKYGTLGVEYMGSTLHWGTEGVNRYSMTTSHKKVAQQTLADGMHNYTFTWTEDAMKFYLDGSHVVTFATPSQGFFKWGNLPGKNIWAGGAKSAPFDQKFYLIINVAVGGTNGFFPDGVPNEGYSKPWSNRDSDGPKKFWLAKNKWYPTWHGDDAAMQVESVKMWQLA